MAHHLLTVVPAELGQLFSHDLKVMTQVKVTARLFALMRIKIMQTLPARHHQFLLLFLARRAVALLDQAVGLILRFHQYCLQTSLAPMALLDQEAGVALRYPRIAWH